LESGYFAIYHTDVAIDPKKFEDPASYFVDDYITASNSNTYHEIDIFVQNYNIETDIGRIFPEKFNNDYLGSGKIREIFDSNSRDQF